MKTLFYLLASSIGITTLQSCNYFDSDTPQPIFVEIPSVSLSTTPEQGDPSHNITDVWVNANGQLLGVFPLPARIPIIIAEGVDSIALTVLPGIRNDGQTATAFIYRLIAAERYVLDPVIGETTVLEPVFKYSDNAIFDFVEGFEAAHIFTAPGPNNTGNGSIVPTTEEAASGQRSGVMRLDENTKLAEVLTFSAFDRANNGGGDSYIELDYKTDTPFSVGVYARQGSTMIPFYNVIITEKEDWNRIYLDFTFDLAPQGIDDYRVAIVGSIENSDQEAGAIFIDNIKLVHF